MSENGSIGGRGSDGGCLRTAVLACPTLRDEMELAERHVASGYDFHWLDESYHNFPDQLKGQIQQRLDMLEGYGRVLLGFGFCGNAVQGLRAGDFELIVSRVDDCISLLLGSMQKRASLEADGAAIYLTRGWMDDRKGAWAEYEHMMKRLGPSDAKEAFRLVYEHYSRLMVVDDGAYDMDEVLQKAQALADAYGMERQLVPGTVSRLEALLAGPWDERGYVIVPPHGILSAAMPTLSG